MHPIAQRLAIHAGELRCFSARPALQDQGDGQQAPNLSAIAALCCELAQCRSRMLRPGDRDCLPQLILLAANRHRENRTAISRDWESPARVRLFGGWYKSVFNGSQARKLIDEACFRGITPRAHSRRPSMKTMILAAAAMLSIGIGSAFAASEGGSSADTLFTELPGVMAQAPAQNA